MAGGIKASEWTNRHSVFYLVDRKVRIGELFDGGWLIKKLFKVNDLTREQTAMQVKLSLRKLLELRIIDYKIKSVDFAHSVYVKLK